MRNVVVSEDKLGDIGYYYVGDYTNSFRCIFKKGDERKFILDLKELIINPKYNTKKTVMISWVGNCNYKDSNWIRISRTLTILNKFLLFTGIDISGVIKDEKDLRKFLGLKSVCKKYMYNRLNKKSINELEAIESMIAR